MAMPFEVFTDHYAFQWLKTMRTGSALVHRWSAALEEYDFTVHHRPGKAQTHVDGLSRGHLRIHSSTFSSWTMRRRPGNWLKSFIPPRTSTAKLSGSCLATGMHINLVVASAWRSPRAVPNVRWGAIMATVKRRRGPYSPMVHGTRSLWTLWDLYPTTDKNSSSCLSITTRGKPSLFPLAITPQAR